MLSPAGNLVRGDRRAGVQRLELEQLGLAERLVHDAHARPQQHVAAHLAVDIAAEMLVGTEDDLLVLRDLAQDLLGRRAGDDDVAERLHLDRAVDVGQRDMVGMLRAEGCELLGRAAVLEAAAGVHVGQDHSLVGAQDLCGLGHEAHAAEGDHLGIGLRRLAAEFERVADEIGKILNLRLLVIMGQDHRVTLLAQAVDLFQHGEKMTYQYASLEADKEYKRVMASLEGSKLTETQRHNKAQEAADNRKFDIMIPLYNSEAAKNIAMGAWYTGRGSAGTTLTAAQSAAIQQRAQAQADKEFKDLKFLMDYKKQYPGFSDVQLRQQRVQEVMPSLINDAQSEVHNPYYSSSRPSAEDADIVDMRSR